MSLETVLQIGKILHNADNNLKYFKYVKPCPKDNKTGEWPICISLPVNSDFTFNWKGMRITPENEREKLYYLKYTTSDSDSSPKKYLFGDICYTRKSEVDKNGKIKKVKEFGNFTFEKGQKNAFINGFKAYEEIVDNYYSSLIYPFLSKLGKNKEAILKAVITGHKNGGKIAVPKKLNEYSSIIESLIQSVKKYEKTCELIQFHISFEKEIEKFNQLQEEIENALKNTNILKEKYLNVIKNKNSLVLKRILKEDETFELISAETKNVLQQFADFTIYVHFEYTLDESKKSWHQFNETFKLIKNKLNSEITNITEQGLVPSKSIYRTLCSGDDKNDIQFPSFNIGKSFRSFSFRDYDQFEDFLYTGSILNKSFRRLGYTDIDMFVYPVVLEGEQIGAKDYDAFFFDKKDETRLVNDPIFEIFQHKGTDIFTRFDFIFADSKGNTTNELIEISGLEKSTLRYVQKRIETISSKMYQEKIDILYLDNKYNNLQIETSYRYLLGSPFINNNGKIEYKNSSKYESHLLKVLPLIYTANYYHDNILLPSFIKVAEFIIRNIEKKIVKFYYIDLKYHLKFLFKILNTKNDKFMEITSSESYQIGLMLGGLARNLSQEIKIANIYDFIKLKNEIEQKLIMHEKTKYTYQISYDLAQKIKEFKSKYDKEECTFGFMESYFKPIPKAALNKTANSDIQQS